MNRTIYLFAEGISVDRVNKALNSANKEELFEALQDPKAKYPAVFSFASPLYFEEFRNIREEKGVSYCLFCF